MKKIRSLKKTGLVLLLILITMISSINNNGVLPIAGEPNTSLNPIFVSKFGKFGSGNGEFLGSRGIAIDSMHIFLTDIDVHRVQIFDLAGNFISKFGSRGSGDGQFEAPYGIDVNSTHIFVVDQGNNRVQIFDLAGNYVSKFGSLGTGDGEFIAPTGIAVNKTHIFVLEGDNNNRVQIFDLAGNFVSKFGGSGNQDGQFNDPQGIAVNEANIFVVDTWNGRVQIFDLAGNYVAQFARQFHYVWGIAASNSHLFVIESWGNRVQIFDLTGNFVMSIGSEGSEDGQFRIPFAITVNDTHMLVDDTVNRRVQIFALNSAPQQLTARPSLTSIGLTWDPPVDVSSNPVIIYRIYKGTQSGEYILLHETPLLYHNDMNVIVGKAFYYRVTAVIANGESMYSNEVSAQLSTQGGMTQTVTQTTTETTTNVVTSTDTVTSTETQTETQTETTTESQTETTTNTVTTTDTVTTTYTQPAEKVNQPYSLSAHATDSSVTMHWNAPMYTQSPITGYNIHRGNTSDGNYSLVGSSSTTTFTDNSVTKGKLYFYMVTAVTGLGESLPSNIIIITVRDGETNQTPNNMFYTYLGMIALVVVYSRIRISRRKLHK